MRWTILPATRQWSPTPPSTDPVRPVREEYVFAAPDTGHEWTVGSPAATPRDGPCIAITCDVREATSEGPAVAWQSAAYVDAVVRAGGVPVLVPPGANAEALVSWVDALVVSGGAFDIHPSHYGEAVEGRLDRVASDRTDTELTLCREALRQNRPILGICGGLQAMAVATGGTLVQDLPAEPAHEQPTDPTEPWHAVETSGRLRDLLGARVLVNSTHHQAIQRTGAGWDITAVSEDGVVEGMTHCTARFAIGVQWHPELLGDDRLYVALVNAARALN